MMKLLIFLLLLFSKEGLCSGLLSDPVIKGLDVNSITNSISNYSEKDRNIIIREFINGKDESLVVSKFETEALNYISFMLRFGHVVSSEECNDIECLFGLQYSEEIRAKVLRANYLIWNKNDDSGYDLITEISQVNNAEELVSCFGDVTALYEKVFLSKELGLCVSKKRNDARSKYMEFCHKLFSDSKVVRVRKDGNLEYSIDLDFSDSPIPVKN